MQQDIRWKQRLDNFSRALKHLQMGVDLMEKRPLSILEQQGIIQAFEYNHELAWNLLKDYLEEYGGHTKLIGSRDTTREAFKVGLIEEGELWMDMIRSRNLSSHTYNEATAQKLISIIPSYFRVFSQLENKMNTLKEENRS